jgi:hypothetical protein
VLSEVCAQILRDRHAAATAPALRLDCAFLWVRGSLDADSASVEIDVRDAQCHELSEAGARVQGGCPDGEIPQGDRCQERGRLLR